MRETSGRRVMRIMEGQGVDGHVDDESSPKRNAFVRVFENVSLFSLLFSLLSLLGLVLSCPVLSCPVLSCPVLSCLVLSCLVLSCLVLSCLVLSCLVLSCLVVCVCVGVRVCWRGGAILICKSFVVFGCWGDRQTEPSHSWFVPHFPSGEPEYNSFIRYSE